MNSEPHRDRELAERAGKGDNAAWREIYDSTRQRLFALIFYHLGDREEALDVLQETYTTAVRGIAKYRGEGSLESWLCGIALRRARDWKRRVLTRLRRTESLDENPRAAGAAPPESLDERRLLRRALASLSPKQRAAFLLHEWMGYSFAEAGAVLGIAEATARVHGHRARESLRKILEGAPPAPASPPDAAMQEQQP